MNRFEATTKKASKTFYLASLLFPKEVREDVFILYSFARIEDDYIDSNPSDFKSFNAYVDLTKQAFNGKKVENPYINAFVKMATRRSINISYIDDFFKTQYMDYHKKEYKTIEELEQFTYGVAEVIGLMMCQIMEIPKKAFPFAQKLGRAMQLLNIVRDISEDARMHRNYIPQEDLKRFGIIKNLISQNNPNDVNNLIRFEVARIITLLKEAEKGFTYIPNSYLLPIAVSSDLYKKTAYIIEKNPQVIFQKKIKPGTCTILNTVIVHMMLRALKWGVYSQ